ncbi:tyrosine-type recombinase/integrase [Mycoplasmatota bacterium]|nr:tyrosine-type recombinase/integrase [Mycoplasmatota bacterium]
MDDIKYLISQFVKLNNNDIGLEEVKEIYLNRCRIEVREDTYKYYRRFLTSIIDYLIGIGVRSTKEITSKALYEFINEHRKLGHKNNYINKFIGALKQALTYCEVQELINNNPLRNFTLLKKEDTETVIISPKVIKSIIKYLNTTEQTQEVLRAKAMIYILLDTGIRKNELRNVKLENLDLENDSIHLTYTKTRKHRTVFITSSTNLAIVEYLNSVSPDNYLLVSLHTGMQLSAKAMEDVIIKIKRKLNIPKEVSISFHKFRHTFATMFLEQNKNIETVRKILGHTSIKTTQIYLHLSNSKVQNEHREFSPINRFV